MKLVSGPFVSFTDPDEGDGWRAPQGATGTIDLRDGAGARNVGLFIVPNAFAEADYLTLGDRAAAPVSASTRNSFRSMLGLPDPINANVLLPMIVEVMGFHADPDADGSRNPLVPTHSGDYELHIGPLSFRRKFTGAAEGRIWDRMKVRLRRDYAALKARNPTLAAKWASAMRRKLSVAFSELADAGDREIAPTTTYTESFNKADSTTLGPNLTWTETSGDLEVNNNQCRAVTSPTFSEARAEHDLSSTDHSCTITCVGKGLGLGSSESRALARFAAAARTHYGAYLGTTVANPSGFRELFKRVAGTFTQLALTAVNWTAGDTVQCRPDGSTQSLRRNDVEEESVTDTAITTGTRFGVANRRATGDDVRLDALVAEDLLAGWGMLLGSGRNRLVRAA